MCSHSAVDTWDNIYVELCELFSLPLLYVAVSDCLITTDYQTMLQVYKVLALNGDYQAYALKEVYIKHTDPAIKQAYINEIKLLKKLRGKPEIITLHD